MDGAYYLFGGNTDISDYEKSIARFDAVSKTWSKVGEMTNGRRAHSVIYLQSSFLVTGGQLKKVEAEKCSLSNGQMSCSVQNPELDHYGYSELFLVSPDYCH